MADNTQTELKLAFMTVLARRTTMDAKSALIAAEEMDELMHYIYTHVGGDVKAVANIIKGIEVWINSVR